MGTRRDSWASSEATRRTMQGNRSRDTTPELSIRRLLHGAGLRYRVDARPLSELNRRADIVFRPSKVAVFVHGCFWHGCPTHYVPPRSNDGYWKAKVESNKRRDSETEARLIREGWLPVVVWEHEDPVTAAASICEVVRARQPLGNGAS